MRTILMTLLLIGFVAPVAAHQPGKRLHLKDTPAHRQVDKLSYCKGTYHIVTKEGEPFEFPEFNLRFKTDSGPTGPAPGTPVVIPAGMQGDRAFIVFADPADTAAFLGKTTC